jgi:hypothetical protein
MARHRPFAKGMVAEVGRLLDQGMVCFSSIEHGEDRAG